MKWARPKCASRSGPTATEQVGPVRSWLRQTWELGRGLNSYAVVHSGHRSAPRVIAALASLVHDRQSAADYECNHDDNN
jgi:hypothetical protein